MAGGPLGSPRRSGPAGFGDPAHPSRLPGAPRRFRVLLGGRLDAGGAGSPAGPHCGPQHCPETPSCTPGSSSCHLPHHGTADGRRGKGLLSLLVARTHSEKGVLGTAASASLAASPPCVPPEKVSGHLWALPHPCPGCRELRDAPAPFPGDQTEPRRRALRGGAGPAGGAGRQAAPLALEPASPAGTAGCGEPAPQAVWAAPPGRDLRPLTVSRGPAAPAGGGAGMGSTSLARSEAGEWGAGQAGGAGGRSLREDARGRGCRRPGPGLACPPGFPAPGPPQYFRRMRGRSARRLQRSTLRGWVVQGCAGAGGPSPNSRFPHDPSRGN